MMPPFIVFPTNRIAHFVEVSLYLFYLAQQVKLGELEKRIDDQRFLRCHQSYLVNMEHIADVQENFILRNKASVPIRVRGRKEVVDAYNDYFTRQSAKR